MTDILIFRLGDYEGGPLMIEVKYFSTKAREASRSGLLNSYGMHHPRGPNFLLSMTIECKKQTVNISALQFEWSTLSKNSYVIMVVNVLFKPAFRPLGGSFVTLMVF